MILPSVSSRCRWSCWPCTDIETWGADASYRAYTLSSNVRRAASRASSACSACRAASSRCRSSAILFCSSSSLGQREHLASTQQHQLEGQGGVANRGHRGQGKRQRFRATLKRPVGQEEGRSGDKGLYEPPRHVSQEGWSIHTGQSPTMDVSRLRDAPSPAPRTTSPLPPRPGCWLPAAPLCQPLRSV